MKALVFLILLATINLHAQFGQKIPRTSNPTTTQANTPNTTNTKNNEDISKFMGFELGKEVFDGEIKLAMKQSKYDKESYLYQGASRGKFRKYSNVYLRFDPKNRIRSISASYTAQTETEADDEYRITLEAFKRKYKPVTFGNHFSNKDGTKSIWVTKNGRKIRITYSDTTNYDFEPSNTDIKTEAQKTDISGI